MTTLTAPPPQPLLPGQPPPEPDISLDERIALVELRLMAREERVRERIAALTAGAKKAVKPAKWVVPLGGAALSALLLRSWRGRGGAARPTSALQTAASGQHRGGGGQAPWVSLIALAWPLVPARWRAKVSPGTVGALVGIGLPMLQTLLSGTKAPPPVAAASVNLARYAGGWHEVARLPQIYDSAFIGEPTAEYTPRWDGSVVIRNRFVDKNGQPQESDGLGLPIEGGNGAKLRISMWPALLRFLPMAWSDYWILYVDDNYSEALVCTPDRRHLWFLSRTRRLAPGRLQALQQMAIQQGFVLAKLQIHSEQA